MTDYSNPDDTPAVTPLTRRRLAMIALGIFLATVATVVILWWAGTKGLTGERLVIARLDALKVGLSIGVAGGGGLALYLAWRRQQSTEIGLGQKDREQRHQERVAQAAEFDARERRITDLYTKASDQLGSDHAPVRLAGLYALERLAQDNDVQRQTVVFVLCAYLRMPYERPDPPSSEADAALLRAYGERMQELEVRYAAQRILHRHRRPDRPDDWWDVVPLNLTGAELTKVDFGNADLTEAAFSRANLPGADFSGANLTGALLDRANLTEANLQRASLHGANLEHSTLTLSNLTQTDLSRSFLTGATFSNAHLDETKLNSTDLDHADFAAADLTGVELVDGPEA